MRYNKNLFRFQMLLFFLLIVLNQNFLSAAINQHSDIQGNVKMANSKRCVLFDENHTRMTLAKSNGGKGYNWLFLAGGPGADSEYFNELIDLLDLPGNVWLIDLPENGGNHLGAEYNADYDFNRLWETSLKHVLKSLNNTILVGHSFSGLYPLLFPEIENDLLGLVIISSASRPWIDQALEKAKVKNLPSFEKEMAEFLGNKTPETFHQARKIFVHYYFTPETFEQGNQILFRGEFNFHAMNWWLSKAPSINFDSLLVPNIPTLIIGGSEDCAVPFESYLKDERYKKPNIWIKEIKGGSHFPWLEKPHEIRALFHDYVREMERTMPKTTEKEVLNKKIQSNPQQINSAVRSNFAVIYRGYILPGKENDYKNAWKIVAQYFVDYRGAIGSCLHQTPEGLWVAYSRWPDQKTRDASWPGDNAPSSELPNKVREAISLLKNCLDQDRKLPDICMEVIDDLLLDGAARVKQGTNVSFIIQPFEEKYQPEVIGLIERIQVEEFNISIEEAQRKELQSISHSFQKNKGNYWIALLDGKVIGTIAVIDIGHSSFELRDVFLDKKYRSQKTEFAKKLLNTVFDWAKEHEVDTIYLGTTLAFKAAHRFYEKHGFREISREDMPSYCQPMDCDEKFYCLDLK